MTISIESLITCFKGGISYLPITLGVTLLAVAIGVLVGGIIAIIRVFKVPVISQILAVIITIYAGIPMVVSLMVFNLIYITKFSATVTQFMTPESASLIVGIFTVSLLAIVHISEAIRGGFNSVDNGQYEAGYSVGLTRMQTVRRIIIPQVIPVVAPVICTNAIGLMKATSILMLIGVMELLNGAILPCQKTYSFLEGYIAAGVIYWVIAILLSKLAKYLEKNLGKYRRSIS